MRYASSQKNGGVSKKPPPEGVLLPAHLHKICSKITQGIQTTRIFHSFQLFPDRYEIVILAKKKKNPSLKVPMLGYECLKFLSLINFKTLNESEMGKQGIYTVANQCMNALSRSDWTCCRVT